MVLTKTCPGARKGRENNPVNIHSTWSVLLAQWYTSPPRPTRNCGGPVLPERERFLFVYDGGSTPRNYLEWRWSPELFISPPKLWTTDKSRAKLLPGISLWTVRIPSHITVCRTTPVGTGMLSIFSIRNKNTWERVTHEKHEKSPSKIAVSVSVAVFLVLVPHPVRGTPFSNTLIHMTEFLLDSYSKHECSYTILRKHVVPTHSDSNPDCPAPVTHIHFSSCSSLAFLTKSKEGVRIGSWCSHIILLHKKHLFG